MKKFADCHLHIHDGDTDATTRFLDTIADLGVTDASLLSICCWTKYSEWENEWALQLKNSYKRINLRVFGSFHEHGDKAKTPYLEQAKALLSAGCDGIKLIQMKPQVRLELGRGIDHESYDEVFDFFEEKGTPILLHSGDPEDMWDLSTRTEWHLANGAYYDGTYPSSEQIYSEVFARLDKNPRLNIVLAHFFFLSNFPQRAEAVMEKYPRVKFDLTPGWEMFLGFSKDILWWHDFFEKYSNRILFGTDSNNRKAEKTNRELYALVLAALTHDASEFEMPCYGTRIKIKGLALCPETVEKICAGNYFRFLKNE